MRLTVLGNAGRYLAPLSGGSAYLLETDGASVLLDCGGGAREALGGFEGKLDALVLSHFHYDHVLDLPTLSAVLDARTTLFVPPGERPRLDALAQLYAFQGEFDFPGAVVEPEWGKTYRLGDLLLDFAPTRHSVPSMATRAVDANGGKLVYASDSAPCAPLAELAQAADLLLMHALLPVVEETSDHARVHSTARTAARLALEARADVLVLSHRYWESDDASMREAASAHPRVRLARERETIEVTRSGAGRPS